ncbi:septin-7-like [Nomascus leucogenys]|uniref:septin-7-like n=1 Tax=Nomascus leucogenys TaxID=61853 RepID=UPI00122DC274|nr:septin-7-like [Nomascus leucogenys]
MASPRTASHAEPIGTRGGAAGGFQERACAASAWPPSPISYEEDLRLGRAQQRPDFARTGATRQPAGTWRAPSHGGAEAPQWPAPAAAAAAHSPHLSLGKCALGKSTLINSLFLIDLYSVEYPDPSHRIKKTVQVDAAGCWQPVIDYIDSKFEDYLNAESCTNRYQMPDNRVQCCLSFIASSGHRLTPLDIEFMKRLHEKVNIIPLIAKADTLTPEECQQFKKQIMKEIQEHKIKIYEFPETDDEEENKIVKKIKYCLPLAVVGSNTIIEVNGKRVRGRQYPWSVAEVENGEHGYFTILRNTLIRDTSAIQY